MGITRTPRAPSRSTALAAAAALILALLSIVGCRSAAEEVPEISGAGVEAGGKGPGAAPAATVAPRVGASASQGVIIGRVLRRDVPMAGFLVQLVGDGLLQATTDAEGGFTISDVPAGEWLLNVIDVETLRSGVHAMQMRGVTVAPGALIEERFVFGLGHRVHGVLEGLPRGGPEVLIAVFRPGGPDLVGAPLADKALQYEEAKFLAGSCTAAPGARYEVPDILPGRYLLEVRAAPGPDPRLEPVWPAPLLRREIEVGDEELELDLVVPGGM